MTQLEPDKDRLIEHLARALGEATADNIAKEAFIAQLMAELQIKENATSKT